EPILGVLLLPAVADDLAEQAEIVTDAVAAGGDAEARHAFHQTGREPAQPAIAERRVRLGLAHLLEVDAEIAERRLDDRAQPQILDDIGEEAADQEFQRQIIDPLAPRSEEHTS